MNLQKRYFFNLFQRSRTGHTKIRSWFFLLGLIFFCNFSPASLHAQETTIDNRISYWNDDLAWTNGTSPGTDSLNTDIIIDGTVSLIGNLWINNGDLIINDTLLIFGNLRLDTANVNISANGILIVYGDYLSNDEVNVTSSGLFIISGDFTQAGNNEFGSFSIVSANVFILDAIPQIKTGAGFADLTCIGSWPADCGYGNLDDLETQPVFEFFRSGNYQIFTSGPINFCEGDSVVLSVLDDATFYQWYLNETLIAGENLNEFIARSSGEYSLHMLINDTLHLPSVSVAVIDSSIAPDAVIYDRDSICPGDGQIMLSFLGGRLGTGANVEWYSDPALTINIGSGDSLFISAPDTSTAYFVRFEGSCNMSLPVSDTLIVRPLPTPDFVGLPSEVCEASPDILLTGNYAPSGSFSGIGITDNGDGSALFSAMVAGEIELKYSYSDIYGCTDSISRTITVHPLPSVDFSGLLSPICEGSDSMLLTGNFAPEGNFSGLGLLDKGDGTAVLYPGVAGSYDVQYFYTDANSCADTITSTLIINPLPSLSFIGLESDYCLGADDDTISGNFSPAGSFYGDNVIDLGNGTAIFSSIAEGTNTIFYAYTDINACADTIQSDVIVHPVPVVEITGLDSQYDISDPMVSISGTPAGGIFSGKGVSGNQYIPSLAGAGFDTVIYRYTSPELCSATDTIIVELTNYDFKAGARIIPNIDNWCSLEAVFTTIGASPDEIKGNCWNNGPNFNRWFKFMATATGQVKINLNIGGAEGSLRYPFISLWDETGNELKCAAYYGAYDDLVINHDNLTPGEWYYISVDNNNNNGHRGTFSLCVDENVDYDYPAAAIIVPHYDWCSANAEYSTINASADGLKPSCWPNGPNYNRWFKFQATTNELTVDVKLGGAEGDMRNAMVALYDEGMNELGCARYESAYDKIKLGYGELTPANWYYISVDNHQNVAYRGSFTLCIDNEVDYDFRAGAIELNDIHDWCSPQAAYSTIDATPDGIRGSEWINGPNYNRWFKFYATTDQIRAVMKTGGSEGTLRHGYMALWDSDGNEVTSKRYRTNYSDVVISSTSLVPGDLYYISVDNYIGLSYRGTFSLCLTDFVDYDYKEGAFVLNDIHEWCSADQAYTTINATPDGSRGSKWPNGANYDRWFSFTATTNQLMASLKTGGTAGTLQHGLIAVWDTAGNEIVSNRYYSAYDNVMVTTNTLIPGSPYYITVDNHEGLGYRGTFGLCVNDTLDYDYKEAAIELTDLDYWCSPLEAYTTVGASPDELKGSNWQNGPNFNRWFKFQATKPFVKVDLLTGAEEGTLSHAYLALWDSTGAELSSARYSSAFSDIAINYTNLVPDQWYYISVDNYNSTYYRGTFSLCITDTIDYDFKEAAIEINHIPAWCSADAQFSTVGATPDRIKGSTWPNGPTYNRWFKFQANTSMVNVDVHTGGLKGSLRYPYVAIFNEQDIELASTRYIDDYSTISASSDSLTIGNWYYIAVDNHSSIGHAGSFSLCVSDTINYDFKAGAIILNDIHEWCSPNQAYTTVGATADGEKGSKWVNGANYDRWFTFTATTNQFMATIKTGGSAGTLQHGFIALWDTAGNEIASNRYYSQYDNVRVSTNALIPGSPYYITVDNHIGAGYRGSFGLCVNDSLDYDFIEAAIELTDLDNWCSPLKHYTTVNGTPDGTKGSTWVNGPNYNRWFKFQATTPYIKIDMLTGGDEGSLTNGFMALWDSTGNELSSVRYQGAYDDLVINKANLIPGNWYYISVDNYSGTSFWGTFSLCISDTIDYDFKEGAKEINHSGAWCSNNAEYTTVGATPDRIKGSLWYTGPSYNRWFKFRATTEVVKVDLRTGGEEGTLRLPFLAIFNESDVELASARYISDYDPIVVSSDSLTIGNWYYIAVDNNANIAYTGSFTLCVSDTIDYDFKQAAIILPHLGSWCSGNGAFTTVGATADRVKGSKWSNGPNYNRWFKFKAESSTVRIDVKTGGAEGTIRNPFVALFNENDIELTSARYTSEYSDITISVDSLIIGNWYYIAVDNFVSTTYAGSFAICIQDNIDYDFKDGAIELTQLHEWCSEEAIYTTVGATPDGTKGRAWNNGPNNNRWFKFRASTNMINVMLKTGGTEGTLQFPYIALWDSAGNEINSQTYFAQYGDINVSSDTLVPGKIYFISVDNSSVASYAGSFSLCVNDTIDYDFKSGAIEISNYHEWCSAEAAFSTIGATPDEVKATCWNSGPNYNRWFKFRATGPDVTVRLLTGGTKGTLTYPFIALWDSAGTQLACQRLSGSGDLEISSNEFNLTPGQLYYISVDNHSSTSYRGTFSLCMDDKLSYDYQEGAELIPNLNNWCSPLAKFSTINATPDKARPTCWPNGPTFNRWFRFQATTNAVSLTVKTNGIEGTIDNIYTALWDASLTQISCRIAPTSNSDVEIYSTSLVPGNWYYLSVDNYYPAGNRGSFTVCATDHIINDNRPDAILLTDFNNWCSGDAQYTNSIATPDESQGSCWGGADNRNVWFRFVATSSNVTLSVKTGAEFGSMSHQQMALWDNAGNEIACAAYEGSATLNLVSNSLIPGQVYYLSVDDDAAPGTFTLCTDDDISYDYPQGALEITNIHNWCSPDAAFSNVGATNDPLRGSCWTGVSTRTVWFKFQAPGTDAKISLKTGSSYGSMQRQQIALWNSDAIEVGCVKWRVNQGNIILQTDSLTPGNWYWIGVDDDNVPGSFTLCIDDSVDFDFRKNAVSIPNVRNWCSSDAQFSNIDATADGTQGTCWSGTQNKNVWFKFIASTNFMKVTLKTGGVYGNMQGQQMALFNSNNIQVGCSRLDVATGNIIFQTDSLAPGHTYWIAVDDNRLSGSFSICTDDRPDNDFREGAKLIPSINKWCSTEALFSNYYATADRSMGSCWSGIDNKNVWFKFQATNRFVTIDLKVGTVFGNMRRPQMAIWNEDGIEVACIGYVIDNTGSLRLAVDTLATGNWYYLSVDDSHTSGSFSLCFDDQPDYDYMEGAKLISNISGWCSGNKAYTNFQATADRSMASCWLGTENKNVWFRFQATDRFLAVKLSTGNVYGTIRRPQMAIWNAAGSEVACVAPLIDNVGSLRLEVDSLSPGSWYYLSVDDNLTSGSFSLCFDDQPTYDYMEGAQILLHNGTCSPDGIYSNFNATPDRSMASCWSGSENKNVWFRFLATSNNLTLRIKTGNTYGTMRRAQAAIWSSDGTEIKCVGRIIDAGTTILSTDDLNSGEWYYISVDDDLTSGTFTICLENTLDYDFRNGAKTLAHNSGCLPDAAFTNYFATADETMGSCWGGTENKNVWFKFQATNRFARVELKVGNVYGNMRRPQMALWNEAGDEVACIGPVIDYNGTLRMTIDTLATGSLYYISVDDNLTSGSFSLCLYDQPDYDFREAARVITDISAWCSGNEAYSNLFATADRSMGSCWLGTENKNVWFKFQATDRFISVNLKTGNIYGTIRRPQMAIWNEDGDEVGCVGPIIDYNGTLKLEVDSLVSGNWYYISVDDNLTSGTFSLCFDDIPSYDYKEGAKTLPHNNYCSPYAAFSNFDATPDQTMASCWSGSDNKNVWFKFLATTKDLTLRIKTGNIYGSMRRAQAAVWRADGTEVKCVGRILDTGITTLSVDNLTPGEWYFISVDDDYVPGTFSLCLENTLDYDYWDGAKVLGHNSGCSANAAYRNNLATPDESMGSCWSGTSNKNVWFKFQANSNFVTASLKNGNIYGNQQRGQMALWNADKQEIKCVGAIYSQGTTMLSLDTLTIGNWYWISVADNYVSGSFSLCLSNEANYDYKAGAIEIPHAEWCSPDAAYRNEFASADETMGSCWLGSENKNVWFKFLATSSNISLSVKTSNVYGTMRSAQFAIWDNVGNEVKCQGPKISYGNSTLSADNLISGNWYYISVDDNQTSGSFSLCVSTLLDYDYRDGAQIINHDHGCYPDASFNNIMATADRSQGSCWTGTENKNVWFTFQAMTREVRINIKTGTIFGNMQRQQLALWNQAGEEVGCSRWQDYYGDVVLQTDSLRPGDWYYISVDDDRNSNSFTLCIVDSVDYDYRSGAIELDDITDWCSADKAYSNALATADGNQGSCWTGIANKNVWFTFIAETRNVLATVKTGNVYGTMRRQQLALWDESGNEIACGRISATLGNYTLMADTLTPGNRYYLSVDDDLTSGSFSLCIQGNPLDADIIGTDVSCFGAGDGAVSVTAMGGTETSYTYAWRRNGVLLPNTGTSLSNLGPGIYQVTVRDEGSGATITRSYTVIENAPLLMMLTRTNESCPGLSNGAVAASVSGGTNTAYFYNWYQNGTLTGFVTPTITNLNPGWYRVLVRDAAAQVCTITDSVEIVTTNTASVAPDSIVVNNPEACYGTPKLLTVSGGTLGSGSSWRWYLDATCTIPTGTPGVTISVDPMLNTTYWVRAEGPCNITTAVSKSLIINIPSIAPVSATTDRNNICAGDGTITLTFTGGSPGTGAVAHWYSNISYTALVGTGNNLSIPAPLTSTTYFVRYEGICNTTIAASVSVNILALPSGTLLSNDADNIICEGTPVTFTASGGNNYNFMINGVTVQNSGIATYSTSTLSNNDVVSVIVESALGCSATYPSITMTVNPAPAPVISGPTESCQYSTEAYSTALNSGNTYSWTINGAIASGPATGNGISVNLLNPGTVTLQVLETISGTGCATLSDVFTINVVDTPDIGEIQSDKELNRE